MEERTPKKAPLTGVAAEYQKIEQEYRRSVAIVEARPVLHRVIFGLWALADVLLLSVFAGGVVWYAANGMFVDERREEALFVNAGATRSWAGSEQPTALTVGRVYTLPGNAAGTRFDAVAEISHTAAPWVAEFTYQFTWSGGQSPEFKGFALPGVPFYATALGIDGARSVNPEVQIRNIVWQRLDARFAPQPEQWLVDRQNFVTAEAVTTDVVRLESGTVSQTTFNLTNRTPYSYYQPEFVVMVRRAGAPVAVTLAQVPHFLAGETRVVTLGWLTQLVAPLQVDVFPRIPFHEPDAYEQR
jgi:hypothetical protein